MDYHNSADMDFYRNAVKVLERLVNALKKEGRYKNGRLRRLCHYRNHRAMQRINRERGRMKKLC